MTTFKFKAECEADVFTAINLLIEDHNGWRLQKIQYHPITEEDEKENNILGFILKGDFSLEFVLKWFKEIPDGHRMIQTLNYIEDYDGEWFRTDEKYFRDYKDNYIITELRT